MKSKQAKVMRRMRVCGSPLLEQQETVLRLREVEKLTCKEVALRLGVSPGRVQQIYAKGKAVRTDFAWNGVKALSLLPMRLQNMLCNLNLASRARVKAAIKAGQLYGDEKHKLLIYKGTSPRNAGWDCWLALQEWASDDWEKVCKRAAARRKERGRRSGGKQGGGRKRV